MKWLRPLFRRSRVEQEMDAELRFHLAELTQRFVDKGMPLEEARRQARLEFGGLGQMKDHMRDARLSDRLERAWRTLRYAGRSLVKNPGFAAVVVIVLALGIGATSVIFSLLDQVILRDLPVREPTQLVIFHSDGLNPGMDRQNERKISFSYPKYEDFRDHCSAFAGVAARFFVAGSLQDNGLAERVDLELVSGNFFDVLGVGAAAGRVFTPSDDQTPMGHPIAVLGYSYWQRKFGGDPSIVGQIVRIDGMPMTVIGVSAPGFRGIERGYDIDIRIPLAMKDLFTPSWPGMNNRFQAWLNIIARLKDNISFPQAESAANVLYRQILEDESKKLPGVYLARRSEFVNRRLDLWPAAGGVADRLANQKTFLLQLVAMTGIVLVIAVVNLATLLMARTAARQREIAIRLTLGAGRIGVVQQLLSENVLLTVIGGAAGFGIAVAFVKPAARFLVSPSADRLVNVVPDWRLCVFALSITVATSLVLCMTPAIQLRKTELSDVLKTQTGASSSQSQVRFRQLMVVAQLAFCVWLMMAAGLFTRSLAKLRSVNLGFDKERLVTFILNAGTSGYRSADAAIAYRRLTEALSSLPGVISVASSNFGVMTGNVNIMSLAIEGYRPAPREDAQARELAVTPDYLRAMGLKLLEGRDLIPGDMQQPPHVALVNRAFSKRYYREQNPVGRRIRYASDGRFDFVIVGVTDDQRYDGPAKAPDPFYYIPWQADGELSFYVRTSQRPETVLPTIQRVVGQQVPGVPIYHLRTMDEQVNVAMATPARMAGLAGFFGLLATLLAAIGLYGVLAYTVAQRTREIGIRTALGATPIDVLRMVIRDVVSVTGVGLILGLLSGLAVVHVLQSQLYGTSPTDALSITAGVLTVIAAALLSGLIPAIRAATIDPVRALRYE